MFGKYKDQITKKCQCLIKKDEQNDRKGRRKEMWNEKCRYNLIRRFQNVIEIKKGYKWYDKYRQVVKKGKYTEFYKEYVVRVKDLK